MLFAAEAQSVAPDAREECYTGTFDLAPACTPYVSVHLFGEESFKRATLMAALNVRHAEAGLAGDAELPDHIAVLARFAAQAGEEERRELAEFLEQTMQRLPPNSRTSCPCA